VIDILGRPDLQSLWLIAAGSVVGLLAAQELGISGFPTLLAGSEEKGYALVTNGYRPLEDLLDPLERWWASGAPVTKGGRG